MLEMKTKPERHLLAAKKLYPGAEEHVKHFHAGRGNPLPKWPEWCFLPMAGWNVIVANENNVDDGTLSGKLIGDVYRLAAIGTWRYSKGVYRFDDDLMTSLINAPVLGNLTFERFEGLPEWCVYIETPNQTWLGNPLNGFFAMLVWDAATKEPEIRFLLDTEGSLFGFPLTLGDITIMQSVEEVTNSASELCSKTEGEGLPVDVIAPIITNKISPLVSAVLYLCSNQALIIDEQDLNAKPVPKNIESWGEPDKARVWHVRRKN
jgi:hypothetical protein